jgi:leucyl/phenylalanyl-tRNA---protein transferase
VDCAWSDADPAPGLLAAGGDLSVNTLQRAYRAGIFPWYSDGQPILWWSPDPRMVLPVAQFKLHRSLRKTLARFQATAGCELRVDHDFEAVLAACANTPRRGQQGTWILPAMQSAYLAMHRAGLAHSIETWAHGRLVGGLYCTAIGRAVFGESMFSLQADASKIALAALVALCRSQGVRLIDCQQNTAHLASLGARPVPRAAFCEHVASARRDPPVFWEQKSIEWKLLDRSSAPID